MSAFFASFSKTISKLFAMQQKEPPAILLEALAKVLRFGLVAICLAAFIFAIQLVVALCVKQQRKTALPLGIVCAVFMAVGVWAFVPITAAPKAAADSAAVQGLHYISTKELAAREAAEKAESEAAQPVAAPVEEVPADGEALPTAADGADANTTGGADNATAADGANSGAGNSQTDGQQTHDGEENPLLDDTLHRIVATQTELTDAQTAAVTALLKQTKCTRTTRMVLPQENAKNVLLRLENGKRWQILLLPEEGYVYATETTGFLCKIKDYDTFSKQMQSIVK